MMSDYPLCETCRHKLGRITGVEGITLLFTCAEAEDGMTKPKVMVDRHGVGGMRYDEPTSVCPHYESKGRA